MLDRRRGSEAEVGGADLGLGLQYEVEVVGN
jgi:hypothetical protein